MKQKIWFLSLFACLIASNVWAADAGLRFIKTRGEVWCGTDLSSGSYAYQDETGYWRGIDSDLCRVFSAAVFGRTDRFKLVDVKAEQANAAIANNKIDIMLGDAPATASKDISGRITQAEIIYYVRQMFLAHKNNEASSMEDFKGKKVCVVTGTDDYYNFQDFSDKYKLDLRPLFFRDASSAKNAFLLKRCDLYTGNELYLKSIIQNMSDTSVQIEILPEVIADKPVYAQVLKDNQILRTSIKWIINALTLAEKKGITSKNIAIFIGLKDGSVKNLLGVNPDLWDKFQLNPTWVRTVINELGNYGEIYDKNLGDLSQLKIERGKNNLIENGGLIDAHSFY